MKKALVFLLILSLFATTFFALVSCKSSNVNSETYNASKYSESIDLSKYKLAFEDDFEGELNREIWGDTRQGTRRDGYWTKNLAYTDGNGHLVLRTEKRGSRYCSDTRERSVTGYNQSSVTLTYDDCYLFGMDTYGDLNDLHVHTTDLVGNVILEKFEALGSAYTSFMDRFEVPILTYEAEQYLPDLTEGDLAAYRSFYDTAMELYTYYSFVKATKSVSTPIEKSAIIDACYGYTMTFGGVDPEKVDLHTAVAHLFGFETKEEFHSLAIDLAHIYYDYGTSSPSAIVTNEAIENGCFRTKGQTFIFPVAFRNESQIILTYVIVDAAWRVSIWVNDVTALLRAVNYDYNYYTSPAIHNETFCKNTLFVTGPEGVYSGAVRTLGLYTHGFGYYEIRCKLPDTEGIWHAFWMMCGDVYSEENGSTDGVEIDVFEYLPARDAINCALHWDGYDDAHRNDHLRFENVGCADGEYHTFGMNRDERGYTFYIDGKKVWETKGDGICREEGYLKISTEYGEWGDWVGTLDPDFEAVDWVIDYVRVYDKK